MRLAVLAQTMTVMVNFNNQVLVGPDAIVPGYRSFLLPPSPVCQFVVGLTWLSSANSNEPYDLLQIWRLLYFPT
jgi:hypothetical protein